MNYITLADKMQQGIVSAHRRPDAAATGYKLQCAGMCAATSFIASGGAPLRTAPLRTGCGVEVIDRLNFSTRYARI